MTKTKTNEKKAVRELTSLRTKDNTKNRGGRCCRCCRCCRCWR